MAFSVDAKALVLPLALGVIFLIISAGIADISYVTIGFTVKKVEDAANGSVASAGFMDSAVDSAKPVFTIVGVLLIGISAAALIYYLIRAIFNATASMTA